MAPPQNESRRPRRRRIPSSAQGRVGTRGSNQAHRSTTTTPRTEDGPVPPTITTPLPLLGGLVVPSHLETLPVEIVNQVLSYLTHPRSRLAGLTQRQSDHDFPEGERRKIRDREALTSPPDSERAYADLFAWTEIRHPFNALAATSKRCCALVESYCAHLVAACNLFHLPFALVEAYGPSSVYPDMSDIVYRRLWLQTAPRRCIFCGGGLSFYPHRPTTQLMLTCEDCFYAQTLTLQETRRVYHIWDHGTLSEHKVRGSHNYEWVLRMDVEALALKLYGTRAFHSTHMDDDKSPCQKCRGAGASRRAKG